MTPISNLKTDSSKGKTSEYAVGYSRPPKHSQFKKGQSGNPAGRKKGATSIQDYRRGLYLDMVSIKVGNKTQRVPRFVAIEKLLLAKALQGDFKAIQATLKLGAELGAFKADVSQNPLGLTDKETARLTDGELNQILASIYRVKDPIVH